MTMDTYTLVVSETDGGDGITGDVYNEGGTIEKSTFVAYEHYGLAPDRDGGDPDECRREFTADVMAMTLDVTRDDGGFQFRLVGDGSRELATERVEDEEWSLTEA